MSNDIITKLVKQNKAWQQSKGSDFFSSLAKGQTPSIFWIGCCDSRVLPSEILQISLGEMFVHTNIANQINKDDTNLISALEYAINILNVSDIIICGHTHCGGIKASMSEENIPSYVQKWINPIKELYQSKQETLPSKSSDRATTMSVLNVQNQMSNILNLDVIKNIPTNRKITIHGWLFNLEDGHIEQLEKVCLNQ